MATACRYLDERGGYALPRSGAYFANAGWRPGQPWGLAVSVPSSFDRSQITNARSRRAAEGVRTA